MLLSNDEREKCLIFQCFHAISLQMAMLDIYLGTDGLDKGIINMPDKSDNVVNFGFAFARS